MKIDNNMNKFTLTLFMTLIFLITSCTAPKYSSNSKSTSKNASKMNKSSGNKKTCRKR